MSEENNITVNIETVAENLVELLTNSVNMTDVYYDLFFNPEPLDVELQMYNDNNELITVTLPNRAKDRRIAIIGEGSPEGNQEAVAGTIYVDSTINGFIYVKAKDEVNNDKTKGWEPITTLPEIPEGTEESYLYTEDGQTLEWKKAGNVTYELISSNSNNELVVEFKDINTDDILVPQMSTGANVELSNLVDAGKNYIKDSKAIELKDDWHANYSIYADILSRKGSTTGSDTYTISGQSVTIPYTLSTAGEKIVAAADKSKVDTLYAAKGQALYYVLDENNQKYTLPMGTPYGFITNLDKDLNSRIDNEVSTLNSTIDYKVGRVPTYQKWETVEGNTVSLKPNVNLYLKEYSAEDTSTINLQFDRSLIPAYYPTSVMESYTFELLIVNLGGAHTLDLTDTGSYNGETTYVNWSYGEVPVIDSSGLYFFVFRMWRELYTSNWNIPWIGNLQGRW